jgi:DivIVA domain-containing protein
MKISPIEIFQKEFRRKTLNGLDPEDVEEFLYQIAEGVEHLLNENMELKRRLEAHQGAESGDGDTSIRTARSASAARDIEQARLESRRILADADEQARSIIARARAEAERILNLSRTERPVRQAMPNPVGPMAQEYQMLLRRHLTQLETLMTDVDALDESSFHDPDDETTNPVRR